MMSFGDSIGECFFNYMNFRDRAARAEFWWWVLFYWVVVIVAAILDYVVFFILGSAQIMPFLFVTGLALIFPTLTVTARRLHDSNRSSWWLLIFVALYVLTAIAVFVTGASNPSVRVSNAGAVLVAVPFILWIVSFIVLFVFTLLPSNPGNNRHGPNRYATEKR